MQLSTFHTTFRKAGVILIPEEILNSIHITMQAIGPSKTDIFSLP
ncbi:hypothetical protein [Vibrio hepatarius]|nr:hypothetical protein [Vibrio hepatarius]